METLSRRKVDVCCIQKTRYRGGNCRTVKGKDTRYKLYWSGNDKGTGIRVFVAKEWIGKVFEVQRPHSEGEKTPMVWTCGMLQWCSQDSL